MTDKADSAERRANVATRLPRARSGWRQRPRASDRDGTVAIRGVGDGGGVASGGQFTVLVNEVENAPTDSPALTTFSPSALSR